MSGTVVSNPASPSETNDEHMAKLRRHIATAYARSREPAVAPDGRIDFNLTCRGIIGPYDPPPFRQSGIDVPLKRIDIGRFCLDFEAGTFVQRY